MLLDQFFAATINGTPFITACEADVWRRIWKLIAGLISPLVQLSHRPRLLRRPPRAAIAVTEHQLMPVAARTMTREESRTLLRQHHVPWLAALALPDRQRAWHPG